MKFIYFTDIHLCQGSDSKEGFEQCLASMLDHHPQFLINGGDLGITPEATSFYRDTTRDLPMPLFLCNGNHEMCSGFLPRDLAGTQHTSIDIDGIHLVILDVVRYFEPTETHPGSWYGLADDALCAWLENDLSQQNRQTPLIVASHIPLSTSFPFRMGQTPDADFPTNAVANADRVLDLLEPFARVATLHGHDHENCRHFSGHIEIMTTAAVAGNWWRNGLNSRRAYSREPQGYRLIDVAENGAITSQYIPFVPDQDEPAEYFRHDETGRQFVNVFDGASKTRVTVDDLGDLPIIDPFAESSKRLSAHLYELPPDFDRKKFDVKIAFENGCVIDQTVSTPLPA